MFYAAAIGFPGVVSLAIKRKLLSDEGGGYDLVAAALGLADGSQLNPLQRGALYRWDVLIMLFLLPLAWVLCMRAFAPRLRASLTAMAGLVVSLLLFVELKCYWEVGTFLPARVLASGAMGAGRKFIAEYLQHGSVSKLAALLGAVLIAAVFGWWFDRGAGELRRAFPRWRTAAASAVAGGLLAAVPLVPATPFDRSAAMLAFGELAGLGAAHAAPAALEFAGSGELIREYRRVSNAPVPNTRSPYYGAARGYNVLVYLYETLPQACYGDSATAGSYAALRSLEQQGFVARRHYASYPYSRRAYFSIYSGWYPPHGMRDFTDENWDDLSALGSPGMVRGARLAGYETAVFVPEHADEWENDLVRYRVLGFERHVVPENARAATVQLRNDPDARLNWQRPQDDSARALLERDIARFSRAGKPWFFTFNPQLSHGPWPGAASAGTMRDICVRGAPVFKEVDEGLAELLSLLDSLGQRERTIVVALGDHGLRTRAEYPGFRGATLDDITFHVPLIISVPGVLSSTVRVPWTTSHIDIAPSVLDLLGVSQDRELEQGSPLWDQQLRDRRVFVFAQGYLGVDGYIDGTDAVMMNYMLRGVSRSSTGGRLTFSPRELLDTPDSAAQDVARVLQDVNALQHAFMQHLPERRLPQPDGGKSREAAGDVQLTPGGRRPSR